MNRFLTVIVEFFAAADRVVLIDRNGRCKVETDVQNPTFQNEVRELLSLTSEIARGLEEGQQDMTEEQPEAATADNAPAPEPEEDNNIRQRGDIRLHWFYLRSMGIFRSIFWLSLTVLKAFAEKAPGIISYKLSSSKQLIREPRCIPSYLARSCSQKYSLLCGICDD